jgi:hypothetical protein
VFTQSLLVSESRPADTEYMSSHGWGNQRYRQLHFKFAKFDLGEVRAGGYSHLEAGYVECSLPIHVQDDTN